MTTSLEHGMAYHRPCRSKSLICGDRNSKQHLKLIVFLKAFFLYTGSASSSDLLVMQTSTERQVFVRYYEDQDPIYMLMVPDSLLTGTLRLSL